MIKKLLDYFILILLVVVMILASSCTPQDNDEFLSPLPTLELDGRLSLDNNGYYHLTLNENTNQTIHTIGGSVNNHEYYEPIKVEWSSNLFWEYNGESVPTVNSSSYVQENGNINTVIAPIFSMKNDTLSVQARLSEWNIIQTIKIVLE
jgi:hypothetical protein